MIKAVEASGISKKFGQVQALKNASFSVNESEIFGFIGPDGAGKTTLFRILATLYLPDAGELTILGKNALTSFKDLRRQTGYMPGRFSLYQDLTVEENLEFYATVFGTTVHENYDLISDIYSHIEPFRKRLAGKLSGGMKQKLALSCALIHKPGILILDEPTTGVDAVSRTEFWQMLARLKKYNITILVSTPYMDEALRCDRVALIQNGEILAIDSPMMIRKGFKGKMYVVKAADKYRLLLALRKYEGTKTVFAFGDSIHLTLKDEIPDETLINHLISSGLNDATFEEALPGIEDRFLELMDIPGNKHDKNPI